MNIRFLIIILCLYSTNSFTQSIIPEIIAPAGESFQNTIIQVDWTLGELAITTIQNQDMVLAQGFHQPKYIITSADEISTDHLNFKVFPNPTPDKVIVELSFDQEKTIQIIVVDINGKLLIKKTIVAKLISEHIQLSNMPAGNYFLYLLIDNAEHPLTYKIQKIH